MKVRSGRKKGGSRSLSIELLERAARTLKLLAHPYRLKIRLDGPKVEDIELESGNQKWLPKPSGSVYSKTYPITIPQTLRPGRYKLKFKLFSNQERKDVFVALDPDRFANAVRSEAVAGSGRSEIQYK